MNDQGQNPLIPIPPDHAAALARARTAALATLRTEGPATSWRRRAGLIMAGVSGVTVIGALVVALVQGPSSALLHKAPALAALLVAQGLAVWGMMSPRRSWWTPAAWVLTISGAVGVLALRGMGGGLGGALGGWICSTSHLAVGVVPLAFVVGGMRDAAWSPRRALTGGAAVAAAGLFWGEIACERGLEHVVTHHFGAAVLLMAACWAVSRWLPARSHAR